MSGGKICRRDFIRNSFVGAAGLGVFGCRFMEQAAAAVKKRPPNLIVFVTDDQSFGHIACFGGRVLTPHQDRLAEEGVRFNRAYTTSPACTPSRYGILTGQFPSRTTHKKFVKDNPPGRQSVVTWNTELAAGTPTVASVLKSAGYVTGMTGKWHLGASEWEAGGDDGTGKLKKYPAKAAPDDPAVCAALRHNQAAYCDEIKKHGFDFVDRVYWENIPNLGVSALHRHNPEWIVEGALNFIERNRSRPFFLYVALTLPHGPSPMNSMKSDPRITPIGLLDKAPDVIPARDEIIRKVKAAGFSEEGAYYTWIDECVGALTRKLDELGIGDETAIMQYSDHAPTPGKGTLYEDGVKSPALLRWRDGIKPGRVCDELIQNIDFAPTFFDFAGIRPPAGMRIDGRSLAPLLLGQRERIHERLFFEFGWTRAVLDKRFKYLALRYPPDVLKKAEGRADRDEIETYGKGAGMVTRRRGQLFHASQCWPLQAKAAKNHPGFFDRDQFYDLETDPGETKNLAGDPAHEKKLAELRRELAEWLAALGDRPFGEYNGGEG